jgi:hypothetical protein
MQLTKKKTAILALTLILCVAVAFAAYWIYSNIVQVTFVPPTHTLELDYERVGDWEINLTATLTITHYEGTTEPVSGALIHFYNCTADGTIDQEIGTATTDENGFASIIWKAPIIGETVDYYFIAGYEVTG